MTPDLSFTDRATWVMILSWIAPILTAAFGTDVSAYVPAAATVAAGLVTAGILIGKHHLAASIGHTAVNGAAPVTTTVNVPGTAATVHVEAPHTAPAPTVPPPVVSGAPATATFPPGA